MVQADGCVAVHADGGADKPLNRGLLVGVGGLPGSDGAGPELRDAGRVSESDPIAVEAQMVAQPCGS
jgi:hypothetical protein